MKAAEELAYVEYTHAAIYGHLAKHEKIPEFRRVLTTLAEHEREHFEFWRAQSARTEFRVGPLRLFIYRLMRRALGITFIAKLLERHEGEMKAEHARALAEISDQSARAKVEQFMANEEADEQALIGEIKEDRIAFLSNIVLGLNDGLIELTGALVGFTFAFGNHWSVVLAGSITGISAALSMASSAYLQARHDEARMHEAKKSGVYTGLAYLIVVIVLLAPFTVFSNAYVALVVMFVTVFLIIIAISYYTAVLFDRNFRDQALEMSLFSIGVAAVAFVIGSLFRRLTGIAL